MEYYDRQRIRNSDAIERVMETNRTEKIGHTNREARLLGGVLSEINRKGAQEDQREQLRIIERVKKAQNWG